LANVSDLWSAIERYSSFLITSHVRPDPDAIGSEIALSLFLGKLCKAGRIVNDSELPTLCAFLPGSESVLMYPEGMDFAYEALVILDAPDATRTGAVGGKVREVPVIVVDHHPYENQMADVAVIDPSSSSTGEILHALMSYRRKLIDEDIATCLYTAILTDTGRFSYANTGRGTLEAAADLVSLGAKPHWVAENYYERISDGQMLLLGLAATRMRRAAEGEVAYTTLGAEDFEQAGLGPDVAQELAELPRTVQGAKIGVLLREIGEGKVKVSLRSKSGVDVKTVAEYFGGGGHKEASGFLLELPMREAEIQVIRYLEEYLRKRHG